MTVKPSATSASKRDADRLLGRGPAIPVLGDVDQPVRDVPEEAEEGDADERDPGAPLVGVDPDDEGAEREHQREQHPDTPLVHASLRANPLPRLPGRFLEHPLSIGSAGGLRESPARARPRRGDAVR